VTPLPCSLLAPLQRRRWRSWIAGYVIATLILPALGPLPWLLTGMGGDAHIVAVEAYPHEHDAGHVHHDHHDRSDVPGSPTHSPDHHCLACQVLAQLTRCCGLSPPLAAPRSTAPSYLAALAPQPSLHPASSFALTPPARAPPVSRA
jgi:hypothetical protein